MQSEPQTNESVPKRVIKKYPNRRLYDTSESKYVTLNDVRQLVLEGISFCVIDNKSGEDITRSILLQIIIEQEEGGEPIFSTDVLQQIIGFYGKSLQSLAGDFLRSSVNMFYEQQRRMQTQMTSALQYSPLPSAFTEAAKRNLELWQSMQDSFFKAGGLFRPPQQPTEKDKEQ